MTNTQPEPDPRSFEVPTFELRHRLGLALEHSDVRVGDMADYLEVSDSTMSNYLSGRTQPRRGALRAWALRCGVPFEWLETGTIVGPETASDLRKDGFLWNDAPGLVYALHPTYPIAN